MFVDKEWMNEWSSEKLWERNLDPLAKLSIRFPFVIFPYAAPATKERKKERNDEQGVSWGVSTTRLEKGEKQRKKTFLRRSLLFVSLNFLFLSLLQSYHSSFRLVT